MNLKFKRKKMIKQNNIALVLIAVILTSFGIGFAYYEERLNINGTSSIVRHRSDVQFRNLSVDSGSVATSTPATISGDKTKITFGVAFDQKEDYYQFETDIVNYGTMDMMVKDAKITGLPDNLKEYIECSLTYADGMIIKDDDALRSGDKERIKARINVKKEVMLTNMPIDESFELALEMPYIQATEEAADSIIKRLQVSTAQTDSEIDFTRYSSDTNGKGLYIYSGTEDETNPIYYYRGEVANNNVIYAGACWKIVRTTENGGVKLIYNGVVGEGNTCSNTGSLTQLESISAFNSAEKSSVSHIGYMYGTEYSIVKSTYTWNVHIGKSATWNVSDSKYHLSDYTQTTNGLDWASRYGWYSKYRYSCGITRTDTPQHCASVAYFFYVDKSAGYTISFKNGATLSTATKEMFRNSSNSTIKNIIDQWYESNIKGTDYEYYLVDSSFCNDRTLVSGGLYSTSSNSENPTSFITYDRLYTKKERPVLTCSSTKDNFTKDDKVEGNGSLKYPIGLLTADEANLAGMAFYDYNSNMYNKTSYLYTGANYWLNSPSVVADAPKMFFVHGYGALDNNSVLKEFGIRPVISLNPYTRVKATGTGEAGSATNPYIVNI